VVPQSLSAGRAQSLSALRKPTHRLAIYRQEISSKHAAINFRASDVRFMESRCWFSTRDTRIVRSWLARDLERGSSLAMLLTTVLTVAKIGQTALSAVERAGLTPQSLESAFNSCYSSQVDWEDSMEVAPTPKLTFHGTRA
jgi:hypothetical protein